MRFVIVPLTVKDDEPLVPVVKVNPVVVGIVSVPFVTPRVSESELLPAAASEITIELPLADEKTSVAFRPSEPVAGLEIAGGARGLIVRATLFETERLSPASVSEILKESEPE